MELDGEITYVLEGNINYTGAVIQWLVEDVQLLTSSGQAGEIARTANPSDTTYLVPAFSGLGAPYWDSKAKALLYGMTRKHRQSRNCKGGGRVHCLPDSRCGRGYSAGQRPRAFRASCGRRAYPR